LGGQPGPRTVGSNRIGIATYKQFLSIKVLWRLSYFMSKLAIRIKYITITDCKDYHCRCRHWSRSSSTSGLGKVGKCWKILNRRCQYQ